MRKNKNPSRSSNGILVCDSIVMSVKKKRFNTRRIEAVFIGIAGYVAAIMSFFSMFSFNFSVKAVVLAAAAFSALYITLSLVGRKVMVVVTATAVGAMAMAYKYIDSIAIGYKFTYNVIYHTSYSSKITYYKFLDPALEVRSTTIFFIFCAWLLAIVIYLFTIYHPNAILPLLVTFPLIEVGLYNGIKVSIFWGMLLVGYWVALLAMTAIDMGEYSGGSGGFVRKENLFFPKRQMRLKVTEKCGVYIIISVMAVSGITSAVLKMTDYHRTDKLNQKRIEIRDAVNSFSVENFSESVSNITSAFGFTLKIQTHKLGNIDRLRYKNKTDLVVTLSSPYDSALYLKEYTGSVYKNNEWDQLSDAAYRSEIFNDFKKYSTYPQNFPALFNEVIRRNDMSLMLSSDSETYNLSIDSKLKGNRSFAPYNTDITGIVEYDTDMKVSSKLRSSNKYSYQMNKVDLDVLANYLRTPSRFSYTDRGSSDNLLNYCYDKEIINPYMSSLQYITIDTELRADAAYMPNSSEIILAQLIEKDYRQFVYEHYLQLPDTADLDEVRQMYADILSNADSADTAAKKIALLTALRERIAGETEYSLNPGRTPNNRDFVNYFLLENKKGYCTHFATSGVILARMAGIPARYATGYVIVADDFNDDTYMKDPNGPGYAYTINVKDNRSHAWSEIYLDGYGWIPFEFTAGYTDRSIETGPVTTTTAPPPETTATTAVPEDTDTRESTTRSNSSTRTTAALTSTATSMPPVTTGGNSGWLTGNGGGAVPKFVRTVFYVLLAAAAVIGAVLLRRQLILKMRFKRFTEGSPRQQMGYIYGYAEKLLKFGNIPRKDSSYVNYAKFVENGYGGVIFDSGAFESFVDAALRAAFSEVPPSAEELAQCRKFAEKLAGKIYSRAGKYGKFYLKFIAALVK